MEIKHALFSETKLEGLTLRNRIIRAGCFEGMCQSSMVTDNLIEHHRRVAEGGVGMTTVSYCSVSHDGLTFEHEMWMRPEILPDLKRLTDAVHNEGAAASIQLGHSGFFTGKKVIGERPLGASPKLCVFTLSYCREMTKQDILEKVAAFANAASMAKEAGFDAVEIHSGHGYLLSQFMSPWTNKRTDEYGGSLENRLRFTVEVIRSVRKAVGTGFPVIIKMNQVDGMKSGLTLDESVIAAQAFEQAGASALIPSAGFTSKVPFLMLRGNLPVKEMSNNRSDMLERIGLKLFGKFMVPYHPFEPMFLLEGAQQIRKAVSIPVIYVGGAFKLDDMTRAIDDGFGFIQIGRPTIQDPDFVKKLQSGELTESPCDHCNRCVATMDAGGVYCVSNEIGFKYLFDNLKVKDN